VAADQIDGGAGSNTVSLNGDYTGSNAVVFTPTTMVNIRRIDLGAGFGYDLTTADNTVAAGKTMVVDGTALGAADGLAFNGGAETDGRFVIDGGAGADALTGGGRNDRLDGGAGADGLAGGGGDDTYIVDAGDTVVEGAGQGADTVKTALASYTLAANVENLVFTGSGNFTGTGNVLDNSITGGSGDDTLNGASGGDSLIGLAGNDTYKVDNSGDVVIEAAGQGTDTVKTALASYTLGANVENLTYTGSGNFAGTGNSLVNTIAGGNANDTLNGAGGGDTLIGYSGNDTYIVGNAGVVVTEGVGRGSDTVKTSLASYTLGANVENLTYTGGANFAGTGNGLANTITGGIGNDTLNGAGGGDSLIGLAGNDTYNVDNIGDVVTEAAGQGTDTVKTALASYTLGANVENLTYTGVANFAGTGNSLANTIAGGNANDTLNGAGGGDSLIGYSGNDTYIVGNAGVVVTEGVGRGTDTVETSLASYTLGANVENLTYTGGANFAGTGNSLANTITGGNGNDILSGLAGNDTLIGGVGNDGFLFSTALSAATNVDQISSFSTTDDTIRLSQSIFGAAGGPGALAAAAFFIGNAAHDASDRIIYASTSGALSYDPDGTGAASATQFATLSAGLPLANTDFLIV
jgi:Ca2+-binding RTX toxin-like protein